MTMKGKVLKKKVAKKRRLDEESDTTFSSKPKKAKKKKKEKPDAVVAGEAVPKKTKKSKAKEKAKRKDKTKKKKIEDNKGPEVTQGVNAVDNGKKASIPDDTATDGDTQQTCLFVGNLDWNVTEEQITSHFEGVEAILWLRDKRGKFKGRLILEFSDSKFAAAALQKAGETFLEREITVTHAKPELIKGTFEKVKREAGSREEKGTSNFADNDDGQLLFVSNLPFAVEESTVYSFFEGVLGIYRLTDKRGKFKGRAILKFQSRAASDSALRNNGKLLDGRPISVDVAKPELLKEGMFPGETSQSSIGGASADIGEIADILFVSNLPFDVEEKSVRNFFKSIKTIHWLRDKKGRFKGRAILMFHSKSESEAARKKNGEKFEGRTLSVDIANPELLKEGLPVEIQQASKGGKTGKIVNKSARHIEKKPEGCNVVFIAGVSKDIEDEHIHELFKDCGKITEIRWIFDRNTGEFKQCGCVEFEDEESVDHAVAKAGMIVLGRPIRIKYAEPKGSRRR